MFSYFISFEILYRIFFLSFQACMCVYVCIAKIKLYILQNINYKSKIL